MDMHIPDVVRLRMWRRVLQKCGFVNIGEGSAATDPSDEQIEEFMLKLSATEQRR
jgi:hypothetical protein